MQHWRGGLDIVQTNHGSDRTPQRGAPKKGGGFRVNEEIRIRQVRLIDADGHMVGIVPTEVALARAREAQLDLVEVSPNADPPVCKLLDYGKFKYEQKKRDHEAKRKQRGGDFKELRFRPKTDRHDLDIKLNQARRFLEEGNRVQLTLVYRGREIQQISSGEEILMDAVKRLEDVAKVERPVVHEGKRVFVCLMPKPGVKPKEKAPAAAADKQAQGPQSNPSPAEATTQSSSSSS